MTQEIMLPEEEWRMSPEMVEVLNSYLRTSSIIETAGELGIDREKVNYYISRPEAKRFLDNIILEQGYLNRPKIMAVLDDIIDKKLREMDEAEISSSKDIVDILAFAWKIRTDIEKNGQNVEPKTQTNIQINNGGENYNALLNKLLEVK